MLDTHGPSMVSLIKARLTKNKKLIIFLLISLSFIICLSLPYPEVNFTINKYSRSDNNSDRSKIPSLQQYTTETYSSKQSETIESIEREEEQYLAYLPHSGLSNQRIELANGLLLAYMLNRTLIIPPAFLGTVFGWMPRHQLTTKADWLTIPKNFEQLCQKPTYGILASYVHRSQCEQYNHFGIINWSELHDLDPLIKTGIKFKFQSTTSLSQLKKDLHINNDNQIYLYNDTQLYDWRLYENITEARYLLDNELNYFDSFAGRRYYKVLLPRYFEQRTEKLLYLGGIFGSTRFTLTNPEYTLMQQKIASSLHYRLDTPLGETVKSIVNYLGGKGTFMSIHFRTGDKPFKNEISTNLEKFVKNMTNIVGDTTSNSECLNIIDDNHGQSPLTTIGNRVKVYIATDYSDPRGENSQLLPWFDQFPCTTTFNDLPEYLLKPLDEIYDAVSTSKSLRKYLIPIVDAMVAAHGKTILTTPRSTYSKYIEGLHHAWL